MLEAASAPSIGLPERLASCAAAFVSVAWSATCAEPIFTSSSAAADISIIAAAAARMICFFIVCLLLSCFMKYRF